MCCAPFKNPQSLRPVARTRCVGGPHLAPSDGYSLIKCFGVRECEHERPVGTVDAQRRADGCGADERAQQQSIAATTGNRCRHQAGAGLRGQSALAIGIVAGLFIIGVLLIGDNEDDHNAPSTTGTH